MDNRNKRRALLGGVVSVLVIITVLVVLSPSDCGCGPSGPTANRTPPFEQHPVPKVSFVRPSTVKRNTNFSVTVNISEVVSLWGTQFDIEYNPDFITFMHYFYGEVGGIPPDGVMIYRVGSGTDGEGMLRVLSKWDGYSATRNGFGVNGSGYICRLWFHAGNNTGTTGLTFPKGKGDTPGERKIMRIWNGTIYGLDISIGTTVHVELPKEGATPTPTATEQ